MVPGREGDGFGRTTPAKTPAEQLQGLARWWQGATWKRRSIILVPLGIIVVGALFWVVSRFVTDYYWFQELGFTNVFWTRIWARLVVMVAAGLVFFGIFYGNLRLARRFVPKVTRADDAEGVAREDGEGVVYELVDTRTRTGRRLLLAISIALAVIFALGYGGSWERIWLFFGQADFGFSAPVFDRDAAFFVFALPIARTVLTFVMVCFLFGFLGALAVYVSHRAIGLQGRRAWAAPLVRVHLSIILAVAMLGKAVDYFLDVWGLAYSERGATFGPSYTDVNVQIPVLRFLAIVAVIAAVLFLVNIYFKGWRLPAVAIGVLLVTWIFAGQVYPAIIQHFRVTPTEIEKETPYITNNINATRWAFGLSEVESVPFRAETNLDLDSIEANAGTVDNVRVWDPKPALTNYRQIQEIRTYYTFNDVDVDRYVADDRYRQVLISAREFDQSKLSDQAQTWVNQHLTYTHGYGVVISPVSEASEQGLPRLFMRDIPPQSDTSLSITRPGIYYGENLGSFVLVNTTAKEFDYPMGEQNVFTEYEGTGGVNIGSFGRQLVFSIRFGTIKLLVSDYIRPDTRIQFRRSLEERVKTIAPFLRYDQDPYVVLRDDGTLVWIWDAYTVSDLFPNSQPNSGGFNYIRNSIKVVVDAYDGSVTFYQIDPTDAIANAWGNVFPGLLTPGDEMPADICRHLRYPEDLLSIQAETLSVYHMTEPQVFYNKEDVWEIPTEMYGGSEIMVEPYYLMMVLPGEEKEEFVLLQPFVPRAKQNMVSWMAARMDADNYGDLLVIAFPKDKLVFGPAQIEARINNDPIISQQITLWDQAGSDVIRGNLLVIPVEDALVYVEPLYLQAEQRAIPELTRVIVAYGDRVVMEPTLREALEAALRGTGPTVTTVPAATTTEPVATTTTVPSVTTTTVPVATTTTISTGLPTDRGELLDMAEQLYEEARAAQRQDDWATYGERISQLGEVISALRALEGATP
ncbi:MAG: UPF0182 family protein [Thermoleophilia bacterium]|nr:UPF0182 family protein [Thermoleophilia bacterium]